MTAAMACGVTGLSYRNWRTFIALHETACGRMRAGTRRQTWFAIRGDVDDQRDFSPAVARNGRIAHLEAHGLIDIESKRPMPKDGIFRLASMSKPITAVAVMMMLEEGKLRLSDPVSRFIPEFKGMKVAVPKGGVDPGAAAGGGRGGRGGPPIEVDLVPASREITVRDLLTHGSGLLSGGLGNRQAGAAANRGEGDTLATYIPKLGAVPLDFQPGTLWRYSGLAGFDVLSRIVEITSGQPFDRFLKQRLFDPLGMKDTGFSWTPDRASRVVTLYQRTPNGLQRAENQNGLSSTTYFSGAGSDRHDADQHAGPAARLRKRGRAGHRQVERVVSRPWDDR